MTQIRIAHPRRTSKKFKRRSDGEKIPNLSPRPEKDGVERQVYYLSRVVREAEVRYSPMERHCLALVFAATKFRHYFFAFQVVLRTKADPLRFMLTRPFITGRLGKWMLQLSEFDIRVEKTQCSQRAGPGRSVGVLSGRST